MFYCDLGLCINLSNYISWFLNIYIGSYNKAAQREKEIFLSESERSLRQGKRKIKEIKNHDVNTDNSGMINDYCFVHI